MIIRHNDIRDFEANLLSKICSDVELEPALQPVTDENTRGLTGDESRPDIRARGFWRKGQNAYFDIRVTNTNAAYQIDRDLKKIYEKHEREKKSNYNHRIMSIQHGTFTPLIFSVTGGAGQECSRYHRHLAEQISAKTQQNLSSTISWIRCKISFIILKACLMCIRGSRTYKQNTAVADDFFIACQNTRLPQ